MPQGFPGRQPWAGESTSKCPMPKRRHYIANAAPMTSSTPPKLPKKQEAMFREVLSLLEENRLPLAVSGAFSMQQHTGICRDTKDLDIFLPAEHVKDAARILGERGFEFEMCDPVWLAKVHRDGYFVDLITGMSNAVIWVDASWIERASPATVLGVTTRLLPAEELLVSKLFVTRRERFDGSDIAHIIYAMQGKLDWKRIVELVGEHRELLLWALVLFHYVYPRHSDYVPAELWQDLISGFGASIARKDAKEEFRGSLIDPCIFAIDVNEWGLEDLQARYRERRLARLPVTSPIAEKQDQIARRMAGSE